MSERNWNWDTGDVLNKRCVHCGQPMCFDRTAAVIYQEKSYHSYCLLDFLTKFHKDNCKPGFIEGPSYGGWSFVP